jgi:hypothetical protein
MATFTKDGDGDFSTSADREVFLSTLHSGIWNNPSQITNNNEADWASHVAYFPDGRPLMVWMREKTLIGVFGDLTANPTTIITDSSVATWSMIDAKLLTSSKGAELIWDNSRGATYSYANISDIFHWSLPETFCDSKNDSVILFNISPVVNGDSIEFTAQEDFFNDPNTTPQNGNIIYNKHQLAGSVVASVSKPNTSSEAITVYPNPASNSIKVLLGTDVKHTPTIMNMLGEEMPAPVTVKGDNILEYDFRNVPNGVYLLMVTTEKGVRTTKIIVNK